MFDGSTIFGGGSVADRHDSYQHQDPQSATSQLPLMGFASQGEPSLFGQDNEDSYLYSIDELAGVGEAQHVADPRPSRHVFNVAIADEPHADGMARLSAAADVQQVAGARLHLPQIILESARATSPKRQVSVMWEANKAKNSRVMPEEFNLSGALNMSDNEGHFPCTVSGCHKVKQRKCDLR
jgi:hypothetical protein